MAFGIKFKKVSSVKSTGIGQSGPVWLATLTLLTWTPECKLKSLLWVSNTHTFSCTGGIL